MIDDAAEFYLSVQHIKNQYNKIAKTNSGRYKRSASPAEVDGIDGEGERPASIDLLEFP